MVHHNWKKKSFQHKDRCKSIKFTITPSSAELEGVLFSSHSSCVHFTLLPCWAAGPNSVDRFSCSMGWSLASCNAELCWRLSPPCSIQFWSAEPFQRQYTPSVYTGKVKPCFTLGTLWFCTTSSPMFQLPTFVVTELPLFFGLEPGLFSGTRCGLAQRKRKLKCTIVSI